VIGEAARPGGEVELHQTDPPVIAGSAMRRDATDPLAASSSDE
jgi:hypothetical protein